MIQDLKKLRETAGLTQKQVADILNIDQSQVSRYESDAATLPFELGVRWHRALGVRVEVGYETPVMTPGLDPGTPYEKLHHQLHILEEYCEVTRVPSSVFLPGQNASKDEQDEQLSGIGLLKHVIQLQRQKPNVVLIGKFDAGKSRIANVLLGHDSLPTSYQPETRLVTIVRHLDSRPSWMKEDVWILKSGFKPELADSQKNCEAHRVVSGNIRTLAEYGTYGGKHERENAEFALVYLDAPILRACNIVDLPGFRNDPEHADEDGKRAFGAFGMADIVVYASAFTGFLDGNDLSNLSQLLRYQIHLESQSDFPSLGHIFILATHAHEKVKDQDIKPALNKAAKRLFEQVSGTSLRDRAKETGREYRFDDLHKRMFPFWAESPLRCQPFRDALLVCLKDQIPDVRRRNADESIMAFRREASDRLTRQIDAWKKAVSDIEVLQESYRELLADAPAQRQRAKARRERLNLAISAAEAASQANWTDKYNAIVNPEYLESLLKKRFSKDDDGKNEAKKYGPGYVLEVLQGTLSDIIREHSSSLKGEIDEYLAEYADAQGNLPGTDVPFDARGAFLGGMAAAGAVGALAFWAAALGNLGGYILAAKAVSVLAALGISFAGGTAAVMTVIAAIGGPVTLAVAAFVLVGILAWSLFGESWESRIAKKLAKDFRAQRLMEKLDESLQKYWTDTRTSFSGAADALESQYEETLRKAEEVAENPQDSKQKIEQSLMESKELLGFFVNMPWRQV